MNTADEPIIIEQVFSCSAEELWSALTEPAQMRQWYFDSIPDFHPEKGFTTEFLVDAGEREFLHQWEITEAHEPHRLAYRWRYAGYDGAGISLFEVSADERGAFLRLSFTVEEDFNDGVPEFTRESCAAGWEYFITDSLLNYLSPMR